MRRFWLCYMPVVIFLLAVFYIVTPRDLTASNLLLSSSQMQLLKGRTIKDNHSCVGSGDNGCDSYNCSANTGYVKRRPYSVEKCKDGAAGTHCEDDNPERGIQKFCHIVIYESDCVTVKDNYNTNVNACWDDE